MKDPIRYVRPNILSLTPYSTARDEYKGPLGIFLDANASHYATGFNRSPDPAQKSLKERLSAIKGVAADRIFIGNGSDEAIDLCFRIFCEPRIDNAVAIAPSYGMYRVAAAINDVEMREVQLEADFSLDTEHLFSVVDRQTKLLWLCSPNNPSGQCFPHTQIEEILRRFDGMVVLDEAYIDFADEPGFLGELDRRPNLIILQTLSKAWGMAGLRLGLAFSSSKVIDIFSRVKYPYNINVATQQIVSKLLEEGVDDKVREIRRERQRIERELAACPAIEQIFPSDANFVLVRTADPRDLYDQLIAARIIVRDRSRIRGCEGCLRITVGTPAENDRMLEIVKNYRHA